MMMTSNSRVLMIMTLLVGCAPKEAHMDPTTVGESTSTGADTPTDTPTGDSTAATESTSTGADTTDTPTGDSTVGETGEQTCEPEPLTEVACEPRGATQASWVFSVEKGFEDGFELPFDAMCGVESVEDDGLLQTIGLLCGDDARVLSLSSKAPHVPAQVQVGDMVHMQQEAVFSLEIPNLWFALRAADERLLVAGLKRAILPRPEPLQIAPLSFELMATDCEAFEEQACWVGQRSALAVTTDGMTSVVFDGNTASLGLQDRFQILVGDSTRLLCQSAECAFTAEPWGTSALVVWVQEG